MQTTASAESSNMAISTDQSSIPASKASSTTAPTAAATSPPKSKQRLLADRLVQAFNDMDVDTIAEFRSPSCLRHILPSTLGHAPMDNKTFIGSLHHLKAIFHNFSLTLHDTIEDVPGHRIWMYLTARADTVVGEYVNEYVWFLTFDENGEHIVESKEFVDTIMNRDFFPKLAKAMREQQAAAGAAGAGATATSSVNGER